MPSMNMSSSTHVGSAGSAHCRKSAGEAKLITVYPADRISRETLRRTAASSSTIRTVALLRSISNAHFQRDRDVHRDAATGIGHRPDPPVVRIQNRFADRQSHPQPAGLGGVKRLEH